MRSSFVEWFEEQHGPRSRYRLPDISDVDLADIINAGRAAEIELERRCVWDEKKTSALYA